jgi:hypothetical protein
MRPPVIAIKAKRSRLGVPNCRLVWIASLSLAMTVKALTSEDPEDVSSLVPSAAAAPRSSKLKAPIKIDFLAIWETMIAVGAILRRHARTNTLR